MESLLRAVKRIAQGVGAQEEVRTGGLVTARAGESVILGSDPGRAGYARPYLENRRLVRIADVPADRISGAALRVDVDGAGKVRGVTSLTDRNDMTFYFQEGDHQDWVGYRFVRRVGATLPPQIVDQLSRAQEQLSATNVIVNIENGDGARLHLIMNPGKEPREALDITVRKGAVPFKKNRDGQLLPEENKLRF